MLGGNNLETEKSKSNNLGRMPDSPCYDASMNQNIKSHSNSREADLNNFAQNGQSLRETDSSSDFKRLSGELNQRITQEMGDFMSTVSSLIQRA